MTKRGIIIAISSAFYLGTITSIIWLSTQANFFSITNYFTPQDALLAQSNNLPSQNGKNSSKKTLSASSTPNVLPKSKPTPPTTTEISRTLPTPPSLKASNPLPTIPTQTTSTSTYESQGGAQLFTYYIKSTAHVYTCPDEKCTSPGYFSRGKKIQIPQAVDFQTTWTQLPINNPSGAEKTLNVYMRTAYIQTFPVSITSLSGFVESEAKKAIVLIECLKTNAKSLGSGVVIKGSLVLTAAHVVEETEGDECNVAFPDDQGNARHYFKALIQDKESTSQRYKTDGLDFAILKLLPLTSHEVFSTYPFTSIATCPSDTLYDTSFHLGYSGTITAVGGLRPQVNQKGIVSAYGDIQSVKLVTTSDGKIDYQPDLEYTNDTLNQHPYIVSQVDNLYPGASGSPAFDTAQGCLLGLDISAGKDSQGNIYAWIINVGFEKIKSLIESAE